LARSHASTRRATSAGAAAVSAHDRAGASRSFIEGATLSSDDFASASARSAKVITGNTRTQLSADLTRPTDQPAAPAAALSKRWLKLGGAAALVTFAALAAIKTMDSRAPEQASSAIPVNAAPVPAPAPAPLPEAFTLSIDSTPAGAEVFEGATSLGTTPLKLSMASPEAGKIRVLQLRKPGFKPYSLEQGAARGEVRLHASQVAEEPPAATATAQLPTAAPPLRRPAAHSVAAKKPGAAAAAPNPAGDIRLQR
jgi:serine/threonine-protein kinase